MLGLTALSQKELPREFVERKAGELILCKNASAKTVIIRRGWGARYMLFHDGRRQVTDLLLPGDFACTQIVPDHGTLPIVALSDAEVCIYETDSLVAKIMAHGHALKLLKAHSEQTIRLWQLLAAIGQQTGPPRIAAFLMALHTRLKEIGDATETEMPYHLRQQDLADILGMTQVHVSRTMKDFHQAGIIDIDGKTARLLNLSKLERLSQG